MIDQPIQAKVRVLEDRCQGHGMCHMAAPDVFQLRDDGHAEVIMEHVSGEAVERVQAAKNSCPEYAIRVQVKGKAEE